MVCQRIVTNCVLFFCALRVLYSRSEGLFRPLRGIIFTYCEEEGALRGRSVGTVDARHFVCEYEGMRDEEVKRRSKQASKAEGML